MSTEKCTKVYNILYEIINKADAFLKATPNRNLVPNISLIKELAYEIIKNFRFIDDNTLHSLYRDIYSWENSNSFDNVNIGEVNLLEMGLHSCIEEIEKCKHSKYSNINKSQIIETMDKNLLPTCSDNNIFIVHGHDDTTRLEIEQLLSKLDINPIILNEVVNRGKTIIEKLEAECDKIKYAIAIFSPDDVVYDGEDKIGQARPNVFFETGYIMGKHGRKSVAIILSNKRNQRLNSDLKGIGYIAKEGNWKISLAKELQKAGFKIDLNKLL